MNMAALPKSETPSTTSRHCWLRMEMLGGFVFGIWNNVSTALNAMTLYEKNHTGFAALTIFFLLFPGLVCSVGFLILHCVGHRKIGKIPPTSVVAYFFILLFFYPVVPIVCCAYSFVTARKVHIAMLAKLFEGFLDDGPQYVLKLVIVVLTGIGLSTEKDDVIFALSMATSFGALIYFGLQESIQIRDASNAKPEHLEKDIRSLFNERRTSRLLTFFLALPMFAAFALARAFTLAVFLKETLDDRKTFAAGIVVSSLFVLINIGFYRYCGQDTIRSIVFGICSILIPAGYSNDPYYYQSPHQPLTNPKETENAYLGRPSTAVWPVAEDPNREVITMDATLRDGDFRLFRDLNFTTTGSRGDEGEDNAETNAVTVIPANGSAIAGYEQMRGGLFLMLYTASNLVLLSSCAIYVGAAANADLSEISAESDDALLIPLILAVVPGCFFALARAVLLPDLKPKKLPDKVWNICKYGLAIVCGFIAYASLVPAVFWSLLYKIYGLVTEE